MILGLMMADHTREEIEKLMDELAREFAELTTLKS